MGRTTKDPQYIPVLRRHYEHSLQILNWIYDATDKAVEEYLNRPRIGDSRPPDPESRPVRFRTRDHFRKNGHAKTPRTLADAQRFCQEHPELSFYKCSVCEQYHVGHRPKTK